MDDLLGEDWPFYVTVLTPLGTGLVFLLYHVIKGTGKEPQ